MATVLLIDDDPIIRESMREALQTAGIAAETAADGEEGFQKAAAHHPEIIILDEMMPKKSGQEFIEALRATEWGSGIRVIVFTGVVDVSLVNQKLSAGVLEYIDKTSARPEDIVALVTRHTS